MNERERAMKAEHYEHKAEAVAKLRAKKVALEEKREAMKRGNKAHRLAVKYGVNGQGTDTPSETRERIAKESGLDNERDQKIVAHVLAWTPNEMVIGWADIGAEIRRLDKRIEALENAPTETTEQELGDVRIVRKRGGKPAPNLLPVQAGRGDTAQPQALRVPLVSP